MDTLLIKLTVTHLLVYALTLPVIPMGGCHVCKYRDQCILLLKYYYYYYYITTYYYYYYYYRFSRTVSITNQGQDYNLDSSYYILRAYKTDSKTI